MLRRAACGSPPGWWPLASLSSSRRDSRISSATGCPSPSPYGSEVDLVMHDSLGMHGRPGAQYLKWTLNALGTRGPEVSPRPGPGVLRVVATGASETFGQSEGPGREYPRQLEDSLRARLADGPAAPYRVGRGAERRLLRHVTADCHAGRAAAGVRFRAASGGAVPDERAVSQRRAAEGRAAPRAGPAPAPGVGASLRPRTLTRSARGVQALGAPCVARVALAARRCGGRSRAMSPAGVLPTVPLGPARGIRRRPARLCRRRAVDRRRAGAGDARESVRGWCRVRFVAAGCMAAVLSPSGGAGHPGI